MLLTILPCVGMLMMMCMCEYNHHADVCVIFVMWPL